MAEGELGNHRIRSPHAHPQDFCGSGEEENGQKAEESPLSLWQRGSLTHSFFTIGSGAWGTEMEGRGTSPPPLPCISLPRAPALPPVENSSKNAEGLVGENQAEPTNLNST